MAMIIEFYGMPASGKTTLYNWWLKEWTGKQKLVKGTFDHLHSFPRIFYKIFYSTRLLFVRPALYFYHFSFLKSGQATSKDFLKDFLNMTYLLSRYQQFYNSKKIAVFDQGLIQAFWSMQSFSGPNDNYITTILSDYNQHVVVLHLGIKDIKKRLEERNTGKSRIEHLQVLNLDFYQNKFDTINHHIRNDENLKIMVVDASLSLEANSTYLTEHLTHYLR